MDRETKITCAVEHLAVGLVLVPATDLAMRSWPMLTADSESGGAFLVFLSLILLTPLYSITINWCLRIDILDLQIKNPDKVPASERSASPARERTVRLVGMVFALTLACWGLLWLYLP